MTLLWYFGILTQDVQDLAPDHRCETPRREPSTWPAAAGGETRRSLAVLLSVLLHVLLHAISLENLSDFGPIWE